MKIVKVFTQKKLFSSFVVDCCCFLSWELKQVWWTEARFLRRIIFMTWTRNSQILENCIQNYFLANPILLINFLIIQIKFNLFKKISSRQFLLKNWEIPRPTLIFDPFAVFKKQSLFTFLKTNQTQPLSG